MTKKVVDRSLITKRVLPHDQSHQFSNEDCSPDKEQSNTHTCFWCLPSLIFTKRRHKREIAPDGESAEEILKTYRSTPPRRNLCTPECAHCSSATRKNRKKTDDGDELVLAEEGSSTNQDEMVCSICLDTFHIGEQVAWSRMGYCQHVFHYKCILPWAVLGHVRCPVCRLSFWSQRNDTQPCPLCCHTSGAENGPASEMRKSRFCVEHGLCN